MLDLSFEPIPNQKKEMGRIINIMKCSSCTNKVCDYMKCGNYAIKTRIKKYHINAWFDAYGVEIREKGWTEDIVSDFFDYLAPAFPKGLYWESNREIFSNRLVSIKFYSFTKSGKQKCVGDVKIRSFCIDENGATKTQKKHFESVLNLIKEVEARLINDGIV